MKYISFLIFAFVFISCSKDQPTHIEKMVTEQIQPHMDDPSSFELVSIDMVDTVLYNEYRRAFIKAYEDEPVLFGDDQSLRKLDSMRLALLLPDSSEIMQINVHCKIRGKNRMNATVTDSYDLAFTKDWKLVDTRIVN